MVPNGWKTKTINDLFEVQLGKMLNKAALEKNPLFPYLGNSNVQWGAFDLHNLKEMHFNEREKAKFSIKKNDILMCEGGEVGRCAIWQDDDRAIFYQKALHRLRSKGGIIPIYFQSYMRYISGTKLIGDLTSRTSIAHLTREKLLQLSVLLPPLPEQKEISKILSTWDKAIETTEKLISNSQTQKRALMQQLLTGKKRLLDENGKLFNGRWEKATLSKLAVITKGTQRNRNTLTQIGLFAVINGGTDPSGYTSEYNTEANTITISEGGNSCGYIGFQKENFWCGGHCYSLSKVKIHNLFLYQLLKSHEAQIMRLRVGSGLPNIQKKAIESYSLKIPPNHSEQKMIANVLSKADREIELLEKKLEYLKQEKKALMQQLLTGKRRVTIN